MVSYYQITTKKIALYSYSNNPNENFPASGNFCFLLLYFTNSVDQGQPGPDLDPNYLQTCLH